MIWLSAVAYPLVYLSKKLLGITVNNQLNWRNHLYRDEENLGLIKDLSKRLGILKKVRKYVTRGMFTLIFNGLFTSKLIHGITVCGGVGGIPGILNVEPVNSTYTSKEDMRKLQVSKNQALRLLVNKPENHQ